MNQEEMNTQLYEKLAAEQTKYRDWLMGQPPEEILNHAYEYAIREDILAAAELMDMPQAQAAALLAVPSPMAAIYGEWKDRESPDLDPLLDCISDRAYSALQAQRELPVYRYPGGYAHEHGELEQYRASRKANIACAEAIDAAISEHYRNDRLGREAVSQVAEQFGYLRKMAIDGYVVRLDLPELRELVSLLRRSSNNLNQLTRRVHETGRFYDADLEDLRQNYDQLWEAARHVLTGLSRIK